MKQPSKQEQKRRRQIEDLRDRADPFSKASVLNLFMLTLILGGLLIKLQIDGTGHPVMTFLGVLVLLGLFLAWLLKLAYGPRSREWAEQMSFEELRSTFEQSRKSNARFMASMAVGLACWGISILIGMFDFYGPLLIGACVGIALAGFGYWRDRRAEQLAQKLAEQEDD